METKEKSEKEIVVWGEKVTQPLMVSDSMCGDRLIVSKEASMLNGLKIQDILKSNQAVLEKSFLALYRIFMDTMKQLNDLKGSEATVDAKEKSSK